MNVKIDISTLSGLLLIGALFLCPIFVNAQGQNWKLNPNNNVGPNDGIGSKNNADFRINTNDSVRMVVTKEGNVEILNNLNVQGTLTSSGGITIVDSLTVLGNLTVTDSMVVKSSVLFEDTVRMLAPLKIGLNSLNRGKPEYFWSTKYSFFR